MIFLNLPFI